MASVVVPSALVLISSGEVAPIENTCFISSGNAMKLQAGGRSTSRTFFRGVANVQPEYGMGDVG